MSGIEILSVSLSDESVEKLAQRVAQLWNASNVPATQSNPPSSETHRTRRDQVSEGGADPWTGKAPADDGGWPQGSQPRQEPPQHNQAPQAPQCRHGEMRFVPAGFSKSTGKAYNAFYGCPAPRGAQDKCKSVSV